MRKKSEAIKDMLFELDDICKRNSIEYIIIGECAKESFSEQETWETPILIAMPLGNIKKLSEALAEAGSNKVIEYYRNNEKAVSFDVRYCDTETTFLTLEDYDSTTQHGLFIRIYEIERNRNFRQSMQYRNIIRLSRSHFVGRLTYPKNYLRSVAWKLKRRLMGKKKFDNNLFIAKEKLSAVDSWGEIAAAKSVIVRRKVYNSDEFEKVRIEEVEGHKLPVSESELLSSIKSININWLTAGRYEVFEDVCFPEFEKKNDLELFRQALSRRDRYNIFKRKSIYFSRETSQAYRIFLMAVDTVRIRRLLEDNNNIPDKDIIEEYIQLKKKYEADRTPFVHNEMIENAISEHKQIVCQ